MPSNEIALEVFYGGAWHDLVIDQKVLADSAITITRGDGAESAAPRPASLTATLDNRTDVFRLSNPESPLYGSVGRNTPVRVSVDGSVRGVVEATSWRSGQSRGFRASSPPRGRAWTDVEGGGLWQRINNWTEPLLSCMTRSSARLPALAGLWPLEDPSGSTTAANLVANGSAGVVSGDVVFGEDQAPPGGDTTMTFGSAVGQVGGAFLASAASGWQVSIAIKMGAVPGGAAQDLLRVVDGIGRSWNLKISGTGYDFDCVDASGTLLQSVNTGHSVNPANWVRFSLKVSISAGTITMRQQRSEINGPGTFASQSTFSASTTSQPKSWVIPATSYNVGSWFTGLLAVNQAVDDLFFFSGDFLASFKGYVGETARNRFGRLMNEEVGLGSWTTVGDISKAVTMGPQKPGTLAELLREIRDTEDGLIYDSRDTIQLTLRLRSGRYNRTPVRIQVTDLPAPPDEVSDDLGVSNVVTVTNRTGETAVASDSTGRLGTAPPPTGVGEYRKDVDVNRQSAALLPQDANWWLRRGTVDLPRYPKLTVDLAVLDSAKRAQVNALDIGDVVEIVGWREGDIRLFVIGTTEVLPNAGHRRITFTCAPDQQFDVGTYAPSANQKRYDMKTAVTSVEYGIADTTISFSITDDEAWSTTSTYDIMIAGERITIPAGAMGARIGSPGAYLQVATGVIRSRNGVRKRLPQFSEAHVFEQGRWAL